MPSRGGIFKTYFGVGGGGSSRLESISAVSQQWRQVVPTSINLLLSFRTIWDLLIEKVLLFYVIVDAADL
jgi:hypothetical protein